MPAKESVIPPGLVIDRNLNLNRFWVSHVQQCVTAVVQMRTKLWNYTECALCTVRADMSAATKFVYLRRSVQFHFLLHFHSYACDCTQCMYDLTAELYNNYIMWQSLHKSTPVTKRSVSIHSKTSAHSMIEGGHVVIFQGTVEQNMMFHQEVTRIGCSASVFNKSTCRHLLEVILI